LHVITLSGAKIFNLNFREVQELLNSYLPTLLDLKMQLFKLLKTVASETPKVKVLAYKHRTHSMDSTRLKIIYDFKSVEH
jgi:hypothetical protein